MPCTTLMEYMLNIGGRREDLEIKNFHIIKIVLERAAALFQHLLYFRFDLMMMLKIDWQCWCGCWQWFMVIATALLNSSILTSLYTNLGKDISLLNGSSATRILCKSASIDVKIITLLIWLHWGHFFTSLFLPTYWWMVIKLVSCIFRATAGYWLHFPLDLHSTHLVTSDPDSLPLHCSSDNNFLDEFFFWKLANFLLQNSNCGLHFYHKMTLVADFF